MYSGELQIPAAERMASASTIRGHKGGQRESEKGLMEGVLLGRGSTWKSLGFCKCGDANVEV